MRNALIAIIVIVSLMMSFAVYTKYRDSAVSQSDQIEYLQAQPGSPNYQPLPPTVPQQYQALPQMYFYSRPPYYVPGVSISLGGGFWYTPGCAFVFNYSFYSHAHGFPRCNELHRESIFVHENRVNAIREQHFPQHPEIHVRPEVHQEHHQEHRPEVRPQPEQHHQAPQQHISAPPPQAAPHHSSPPAEHHSAPHHK